MTGPPDEWRVRFRASMRSQLEGACPPPETLWRAVEGELSSQELESLAAHLRSCAACGDGMVVTAELVAESEPRILPWRPRRIGAAAAAGIAALAAGLLLFLDHRGLAPREGHDPDRLASRGQATAATMIRPLSKEEQPAADARLQWTPVPGAVRYRVQVSTEDLRAVHDRTLEGTMLDLPQGLADLSAPSGRVFLWQVEALLPDGRSVTSSTFRIRLVAAPPGDRR